MNSAGLDVPLLLSGRKHKRIIERGVAEVIDLVLLIVTSNVLVAVAGEAAVAREGIANSRSPAQTGLTIVESSEGLSVQYDLLEITESHWHWTSDGVTVAVPRKIAEQCKGFVIDAKGDKLSVVRPLA